MMHGDLLKWLRDDPELIELMADFEGHALIYWAGLPRQAEKLKPGMVLTVVSVSHQFDQAGAGTHEDLVSHRIQFDVHGHDPLDAQLGYNRLLKLLNFGKKTKPGVRSSARITKGNTVFCKAWPDGERGPDLQDRQDGVDIFTSSGDFIIWHRPVVDGSTNTEEN